MPTVLYGAETWNMGAAEKMGLNLMAEESEEHVWSNMNGLSEE